MRRSKRYKKAQESIREDTQYTVEEAVTLLKNIPGTKFDETVEISLKLSADPKKSDQMVRGSVVLPHGTGRDITVLVFCEAEKEGEARDAGADHVGGQELIEKIQKESWLDFDSAISTPTMMRMVSRLGKMLGPRGLMPSPKTGTVTDSIASAVKAAKAGKVDFRMDKFGCCALGVGKVSFPAEALCENIRTFQEALAAARPASVKGELIESMYISNTMSPSLRVKL